MNYWLDTHLYQQSNKTSPPNATGWRALGVGDLASMSIMA